MDSNQKPKYEPKIVPHPGDTVVEYLEFHGWLQSDLARRTGLTTKTLSEICNGKAPISPATSIALERVFRRPAHFWLNLQRQYDEVEARNLEFAKITQWRNWAKSFPLREMMKKFWIEPGRSDVDTLLNFFGVSSPDGWNSVWNAFAVTYRQTRKFQTSDEAVSAWVRETERIALKLDIALFDEQVLRSKIEEFRRLTRQRADEIIEPTQNIGAAAGVAVVWVPELSRTGISGCARWLSDNKALIGLTLRFKTDDQMWFTFFHELGHILLHRKKKSFVLDNAVEGLLDQVVDPEMQQYESEANIFSANTLIPPNDLAKFIIKNEFTNDSIHDFAEDVGVGPGIVVGRLQFEGILKPHQGNALKQRLDWKFLDNEKIP